MYNVRIPSIVSIARVHTLFNKNCSFFFISSLFLPFSVFFPTVLNKGGLIEIRKVISTLFPFSITLFSSFFSPTYTNIHIQTLKNGEIGVK